MIIIRKDNEGGVPITEVLEGAVFDYLGDVYMKVSDHYNTYNAVKLENGLLTGLNVNVIVTPLEVELIIRGEYNAD